MPLSADPNATTDYSLRVDADKPAESRPAFLVRFMSKREHQRVSELADKAFNTPNTEAGGEECYTLLCETIAVGVVGWRNMNDPEGNPVVYESGTLEEKLCQFLTQRELWELARSYPHSVRLAGGDRFLSPSPSASDGA